MQKSRIFVFGSNLAGRHGKGAALYAMQNYGARPGIGFGPTGSAYAIPTKDGRLTPLPLTKIQWYCSQFKLYAYSHPEKKFLLTAIGCGLARYKPEQIAPFFADVAGNVELPAEFKKVLQDKVTE